MSETPPLPDRRHVSQQELFDLVHAIEAKVDDLMVKVVGLLDWQQRQADEDRVRRDREQRDVLFAEWNAGEHTKRRVRVESYKRVGRAVGAILAAADAIGVWEILAASEHGVRWSLQAIVVILLGVIASVLLIL